MFMYVFSDMILDQQVGSGQLSEDVRHRVHEALLKQHHHQNQKKLSNRIPIVRSFADIGKKQSEPHSMDKNGNALFFILSLWQYLPVWYCTCFVPITAQRDYALKSHPVKMVLIAWEWLLSCIQMYTCLNWKSGYIVHLRAGQSYSRELAEVLGAVLVCLSILGNCMARYFQCSLGTL